MKVGKYAVRVKQGDGPWMWVASSSILVVDKSYREVYSKARAQLSAERWRRRGNKARIRKIKAT